MKIVNNPIEQASKQQLKRMLNEKREMKKILQKDIKKKNKALESTAKRTR